MAKKNKVTLKDIRLALGEKQPDTSTITVGVPDHNIEIIVKKTLSLEERGDMINGITNMLFVNDGENGEQYCPYLKKLAFEYHIISFFTNIVFPANANEIWDFLNTTDIVRKVTLAIPEGVLEEIFAEANEMIEYRKNKLVRQGKLENMLSGVTNLVNTINSKLEGADGKAILEYLEKNIPELRGELGAFFQKADNEPATNT